MQFTYTLVYGVKGVTWRDTDRDRMLLSHSDPECEVTLTSSSGSYTMEGDRAAAVGGLMLGGLVRNEVDEGSIEERIDRRVGEIRSARAKRLGNQACVVISIKGVVDPFLPSLERDLGSFIVCFDGTDKEAIRERYRTIVTSALAAMTLAIEDTVGVSKVADSVVFHSDDGRPVFSYTLRAGSGGAYVSRPFDPALADKVRSLDRLLGREISLQRVQGLLVAAGDGESDNLRRFLAGWSALEIFINKVFPAYEAKLLSPLSEGQGTGERFVRRIRTVMTDKYRLGDKFAAIAYVLSPETAEHDLRQMLLAKRMRDGLLHGDPLDDESLPLEPVVQLATRYLRRHLSEPHERGDG